MTFYATPIPWPPTRARRRCAPEVASVTARAAQAIGAPLWAVAARAALAASAAMVNLPIAHAASPAADVPPPNAAPSAQPAAGPLTLQPCRLKGVEHEARCGVIARPLDPAQPQGRQIDIHFAVLPALARNKKADPVMFFAGGPGQSAIELAGPVSRITARFLNRRDVILIDQRGTGRSAPLDCGTDAPTQSIRDSIDPQRQLAQMQACRERLQKLPYGDLRQYTTTIAMADADAVRQALGVERVNLIGGSYGTRAALEYLRQFPTSVRRTVIDGVAPPDMALPASFSPDTQAAFDALLADCARDAACQQRYPQLRAQWQQVLASLPREVTVTHPVTAQPERLTLSRDHLVSLVRAPLYAPVLAAALPYAISEAAGGRFEALVGLASSLANGRDLGLAMGMHYSVVCAEDLPRLPASSDRPGADFGDTVVRGYTAVCADWPRGRVPAAFYTVPAATSAVLLLSGQVDPVTPPRHAARMAQALGTKARQVVVPNTGHGTLSLGCMNDVVFRFVDNDDEADALQAVEKGAACSAQVPRPPAFAMPSAPSSSPAASATGAPR